MIHDLILAFWFFMPAGAANAAPIVAAHTPALQRFNQPLDCAKTWHGKPILGNHKTWRGLIAGIVLATACLWLQQAVVASSHPLATFLMIDYHYLPLLLLGPLFGVGALGADAIESFFKRRVGIAPGLSWFPFDQFDFIIGAAVATAVVVRLPIPVYAFALLLWPAIHLAASFTGYQLGLKARPI